MLTLDEKVRQETVKLLQALVRIRSGNPPGNEDEIAAYVKDFLAQNDIDTTLIPLQEGRSSVVARIAGSEPGSIVLCGHLDTVNVNEEKWSVPPFEGRIEDGKIYGRGTADMKGGVAVILEIAKLITQEGESLNKSLVLVLTADEEWTYRGAASVAQSGLIDDAEFLLITEPTGGQTYIGQKGELWVEATFSGKAAHGAVPELGVNTILPAAAFCLELAAVAEGFKEQEGRGRTSLNIGQFNGGWQVNIVPDTARVRLDFRVISEEEKARVLNLVQKLGNKAATEAGARFSSKVSNYKEPIVSDLHNPYVRNFLRAVAAVTGSVPKEEIAPYSTDAVAIIPKLGIPVVIYGPGSIAQAHQLDEFLELSSLYEALDVFARFLQG